MKTNRKHGFTVVELVVVIAIIAVLAAVLIPTFASIIKKANDSAYLQERTNQQIADLAEKVENLNYFTWEDFEKKLAEELAKVGSTDTAKIQAAVDAAIAKYSDSSQTGNTGLTEAQVKKIVEEAMKGQLTTAQVEAIVRQVLSGTTVSEETIRTIVNNAVKGMSTTGVTKAQVEQAIKAAISGTIAVNDEQLEAAVTNALKAFGVSTITDQKVEEIVSNLKNVITINEEAGFSAATNTGSYAIDEDDANKVYYLVTDAALNSFTITGSTNATTIIIDAPNIKDVTIEGNAKVLRVLRTADESTHIKGTVTTLEVNSGRVVIEAGATVGTIKAAPAKQATVTIVLENGSKVTDLNSEFQYYAGTNDYIKIIDNGATIGNSFITSSSAVTTSTTTNVVLTGPAFVDTTTETLKVKNESGVDAQIKVIDAENNETTYTTNGQSSNLTLFAGGSGTEADPYLIYDFATMQNISKLYDSGYNYFAVDISKTDNGKIDCTGWIPVKLHGSFNGNGVKFTNVTACLFQTVGYQLQNENILLEDFDATMNVSANGQYGAAALIKCIFNAGVTTFDNVNVHGYLEGFWNMGSFYNYGTANYDGNGCNYEVVFNDCNSDATLVCASGNTCGGFVGHSYEGTGNQFIMRINNSSYVGTIFTTTGKAGAYIAMSSNHGASGENGNYIYVDGIRVEFNDGNNMSAYYYSNTKAIAKVTPVKGENGYTVAKQSNVSRIEVTITAQLTAYDSNDEKITNLSGITMTLSSKDIEELDESNIKVLDLFNSVNIVKNAAKYNAYISNGEFYVEIASSENYKSGNIRLQVNQYDSTGLIVSAGTIDLVISANANSDWVIQ